MDRLQKVIAKAGVCSRRKAEELIAAGRVQVNGEVVTRLGSQVDPERDEVKVDGRVIQAVPKAYFVLNKPAGVVTTASDPQGRRTVLDLLGDVGLRLFPVGRLDYETEGLLIMTNDGKLAHRLMHPSYEIDKVYVADLKGDLSVEALKRLRRGVPLADGLTAPARVRVLERRGKESTRVEITIHEGRNRQIRRMAEAVGFPVIRLRRVRVGPIELGEMPPGSYRRLTHRELARLKRSVSLDRG